MDIIELVRQANALRKLKPGWDGEGSGTIGEAAIQAAIDTLRAAPHLTPTSQGGVQIDWPNGVEIEFDRTGNQVFE